MSETERPTAGENASASAPPSTPKISHLQRFSDLDKSDGLRTFLIAIVALLMSIPLSMVRGVVAERQANHDTVLYDIASTWGHEQVLAGPILAVPYTEVISHTKTVRNEMGAASDVVRVSEEERIAFGLPEVLTMEADIQTETRLRSLYETLVYSAEIRVEAEFDTGFLSHLPGNIKKIHRDKAYVVFGLSDTGAIDNVDEFVWNNSSLELSAGAQRTGIRAQNEAPIGPGFHGQLHLPADKTHTMAASLRLKGTEALHFLPLGKNTSVSFASNWPHPSFSGNVLPDARSITPKGFNASWDIPHLVRSYPQSFTSQQSTNLASFYAGVKLYEPLSLYSQVTRAIKYGILFVLLTYIALFIFERSIGRRLHIVQYGLIGAALALFFLLLLSLSEHIGFLQAYLSGAAFIVVIISSYVYAALSSFARAAMVAVVLAGLYSTLLVLLRLEDFALLMGTFVLLFVLAVLMFVTRNATVHSTP